MQKAASSSAPNPARHLDDAPQLRLLLDLGQRIALDRAGEAALRAKRELLQRGESRSAFDSFNQLVFTFQRSSFCRNQPQHDLLYLRQEAQRLEAAGPLAVVLQEIAVDIDLACAGSDQRLQRSEEHTS